MFSKVEFLEVCGPIGCFTGLYWPGPGGSLVISRFLSAAFATSLFDLICSGSCSVFVIILRPYCLKRGSVLSLAFLSSGYSRIGAGPGDKFLYLSSLEATYSSVRMAPSVLRVGEAMTILGLLKSFFSECRA